MKEECSIINKKNNILNKRNALTKEGKYSIRSRICNSHHKLAWQKAESDFCWQTEANICKWIRKQYRIKMKGQIITNISILFIIENKINMIMMSSYIFTTISIFRIIIPLERNICREINFKASVSSEGISLVVLGFKAWFICKMIALKRVLKYSKIWDGEKRKPDL